jgi:hypothetical protein
MTPLDFRTEGNKLLHDTMKQLITISSGSILITIAFLEKFVKNPRWNYFVLIAFIGLLACIVLSLIMMRAISLKMGAGYTAEAVQKHQEIEDWVYPLAVVTFSIGVSALVVFVVTNLFFQG